MIFLFCKIKYVIYLYLKPRDFSNQIRDKIFLFVNKVEEIEKTRKVRTSIFFKVIFFEKHSLVIWYTCII